MRAEIELRLAVKEDAPALTLLMELETNVHRHLDWRQPDYWLEYEPFWVLAYRKQLLAVLACPPDPPRIAWIRLFASGKHVHLDEAWYLLFKRSWDGLNELPYNVTIAAVSLQNWFSDILEKSFFNRLVDIVVLERIDQPKPVVENVEGIFLRSMNFADLPEVEKLDNLAFSPLWQNSLSGLSHAYRQCSYSTVIEMNGEIVGYQMSALNSHGAHLARLAVNPELQRRRIGYLLVQDMNRYFAECNIRRITVNTQQDNQASVSLYQKCGFVMNEETFPVWVRETKPSLKV